MTLLEKISKLFGGKGAGPTIAQIAKLADEAEHEVEAAREALAALEREAPEMLLSGKRQEHRQAVSAARARIEDAMLAADALRRRLTTAKAEAAEAARSKAYSAAKAQRDAAADTLRRRYPELAREMVALLKLVAEADQMVEAVNRDLPVNVLPLDDVESTVRDVHAMPREVVDERVVERWCLPGSMVPVPDQGGVRDVGGGRGVRVHEGPVGRFQTEYAKVALVERRVKPATTGQCGARLLRLDIPGFNARDPAFWPGLNRDASPAEIIRRLDALAAAEPAPATEELEIRVEYVPVPVPAVAAE